MHLVAHFTIARRKQQQMKEQMLTNTDDKLQ